MCITLSESEVEEKRVNRRCKRYGQNWPRESFGSTIGFAFPSPKDDFLQPEAQVFSPSTIGSIPLPLCPGRMKPTPVLLENGSPIRGGVQSGPSICRGSSRDTAFALLEAAVGNVGC